MIETLKEYSILYVEDDEQIRHLIGAYLEGYFGCVYSVRNGEEGWRLYRKHQPHACLLDIDLPVMDGLELARRIRQDSEQVSIVLLTAFATKEILLQAVELKLLTYIEKPIDFEGFESLLKRYAYELNKHYNNRLFYLSKQCVWDKKELRVYCSSRLIPLRHKERVVLELLIKHHRNCVTFEEFSVHLWVDEIDQDISLGSLKNIMTTLRKKIPGITIKNVYAKGYMLI